MKTNMNTQSMKSTRKKIKLLKLTESIYTHNMLAYMNVYWNYRTGTVYLTAVQHEEGFKHGCC